MRVTPGPSSFSASDAVDAQYSLTVSATGGTFRLATSGGLGTAPIAFNASAAELQAAIDAADGAGSAAVSGGPGNTTGSKPYTVTLTGPLHGQDLELKAEGAGLTGPAPSALTSEIRRGQHPDSYTILLTNTGTVRSSGTITVTDTLPPGVTTAGTPTSNNETTFACLPTGAGRSAVTCTSGEAVEGQHQAAWITVPVLVAPTAASPLTDAVEVTGGGSAEPVNATATAPLAAGPPPFGALSLTASALGPSGLLDAGASDHPAAFTTAFDLPSTVIYHRNIAVAEPTETIRRTVVDLPPGLVGDPAATGTCSLSDLANFGSCARATQVGVLGIVKGLGEATQVNLPIFNITPEGGYAAEFGVFEPAVQRAVLLYGSVVGTGADAHIRVTSANIPQSIATRGISTVFFGNPAARDGSPSAPVAFLANASDCSATGFTTTVHVDSWENPGTSNPDGTPNLADPNWHVSSATAPPVTGCERLHFSPTFSLTPDTGVTDTPSGLNVQLHIPQNEDPEGLATPPLRDAVVTLPEGVAINPSSASGLEACSGEQIALTTNDPSSCPPASQVATATLQTPLLTHPLAGRVYVGAPECSPCGNADAQEGRLIKLYIEVHDAASGVVVKLPGTVKVDPASGRLTASFLQTPQLPFEDLKLAFKSGPTAATVTPSSCGTYATSSEFSPWGAPQAPVAQLSSTFEVTEGCQPRGFSPSLSVGTLVNQAGAYSPLTLALSRTDSDQQFNSLSLTLPPGLLAKIAGVPQCGPGEAATGACPAASQIGTVTAAAGAGPSPYYVTGRIFLTTAYNGGAFGEVAEVPAVAGPFNLGTVVVRGSIRIDPTTAQASIVSDPFPQQLAGIPLQLRRLIVNVDRPGFVFNPTSCEPMTIAVTPSSTQGARAPLANRYQAAGCASLPFKPGFEVSTLAHTSKTNGAGLDVNVASHPGEANIHKVDVQLPLSLPSRLTTLQKACLAVQFAANPAACPAGSFVGTAVAHTPLLAAPLSGPAILVSHGGAAFPDLVLVLQGEGVTIDLTGNTDIKHGVTFSRFETVPDAPISTFALNLPEGPHSALGAYGSLCAPTKSVTTRKRVLVKRHGHTRRVLRNVTQNVATPLTMPTRIVGQNGAVTEQTTRIHVLGCPKHRHRTPPPPRRTTRHARTRRH
jgi:uncharacterized repeat protein (TIGR01451 family)